jgi:hypothetical protein
LPQKIVFRSLNSIDNRLYSYYVVIEGGGLYMTNAKLDKIAADFLTIVPANRLERATVALHAVLTAYADGEIYNTVFKDAKETLGWCIDESFKAKTRLFGSWKEDSPYLAQREANNDFSWHLGFVSNLHNTISLANKLAKLKPTTTISKHNGTKASEVSPDYIQVAQEFADATQPLALLFKELKPMIVKGRKPNPEAIARKAAELAKKDMKTCGCCFRTIARLQTGLRHIADHGFTLPYQGQGWGRQGGCPGSRFAPLEMSNDGLVYMVEGLTDQAACIKTAQEAAPEKKSFTVKKNYWGKETVEVTPDDPSFPRLLSEYVRGLEKDLEFTKTELVRYTQLLAEWKPTHTLDGKVI